MSMNPTNKAGGFIPLPKKRRKKEGASWTLSYGDMVTALLCFFIIFYAVEKRLEKNLHNPLKGYAQTEGTLTEHKSGIVDTNFKYAVEELDKIPGIHVEKTSSFVDIFFKKTVFFNKGEIVLTQDGKTALDEVISRFAKIEGKYILEIQGHADSTQVKSKKSRWWKSNMELSVLRALNVHSYLAENYIEKNNLIVSGHGDLKRAPASPEDSEDINRRISLRLQLVK